jgi:thioredoxin-related protein
MKLKWFGFHLVMLTVLLASTGTSYAGQSTDNMYQEFDDSEVMRFEYPEWFSDDPFFDLQIALRQAKAEGKQGLMVMYATQGCSYANVFIRRSLDNPEIASMIQKNFISMGLEIFDDAVMTDTHGNAMTVVQFARQQQVEFSPTLMFFDLNGKRVLRATGYQSTEHFRMILDYVTGKHYKTASLSEYVARVSGETLQERSAGNAKIPSLIEILPDRTERKLASSGKPLLVLFEKDSCQECNDFNDYVLALSSVRELLEQFDVLRLDAEDTKTLVQAPDGRRLTSAEWFKETGFAQLPALQFFDTDGKEALKTDALVLRQRMMNSMHYVLEKTHKKGWSYQRLARAKAIERNLKKQQ